MHGRFSAELEEEKACNRFASSLLLPAVGAREHLGVKRHSVDWKELSQLKQEYGLSMAAILYRCKDLGILTEGQYKRHSIDYSKRGWRKAEPDQLIPLEQTRFFEQLVYRSTGEGLISDSKAAELLKMPVVMFRKTRMMEGVKA